MGWLSSGLRTMADLQYALNSSAYKEGAQADGAKFVNPDRLVQLLTEENRVVWPSTGK